jgi:hypothetical protein
MSRFVTNCTINVDGNAQMIYGARANVANAAGAGAGDAVTTALTFEDQYGNGTLPPEYSVVVTPSQACMVSVTDKTTSGFNVVLTPASGTLEAGTFDLVVVS